jgi:histidine triad (HIT) family protein
VASECIFCRIVTGELPSHEVGFDQRAYAFLDINPLVRGHTLVVPREHVADLPSASDHTLADIGPLVTRTARLLVERLDADGVNIVQSSGSAAGQEVFHLHVHLVPRWHGDRLLAGFHRPPAPDVDLDELRDLLTR